MEEKTVQTQRYVSGELSHFVGRGKTEEEQYDILVNKVLKSGWLTYAPHDLARPRGLALDMSQPISSDKALKYEVVCFCDIPDSDLAIHTSKYSRFGLSFRKQFLIERGASPVFYVANESPTTATEIWPPGNFMVERVQVARTRKIIDRALYFSVSVRQLLDIFAALDAICSKDENERFFKGGEGLSVEESKNRLRTLLNLTDAQTREMENALRNNALAKRTIANLRNFLVDQIFSFIKCFDANRTFEDAANYYMEREWRIASHLNFKLDDVARVFFPSHYAKRFRADVPEYMGQISFLD